MEIESLFKNLNIDLTNKTVNIDQICDQLKIMNINDENNKTKLLYQELKKKYIIKSVKINTSQPIIYLSELYKIINLIYNKKRCNYPFKLNTQHFCDIF